MSEDKNEFLFAEYGSTGNVNFLKPENVTAYDSKGEEMEIPKCKNGHYKCQVIGKKYSQWVCLQCGEG